jgi:hypothetical protein
LIKAILGHISFNTTLLFDLDNTVHEPLLELGSDQWFEYMINLAVNNIDDKEQAVTLAVAVYYSIQDIVKARAIEQTTVNIIKALQDIGVPIIAITARGKALQSSATRQLKDNEIDFSRNAPKGIENMDFCLESGESKSGNPYYQDGIIYCSGNNKGKCLSAFLGETNTKINHVVMADDKEKHLNSVKEAVEASGARFTGIL